MPTTYQATHMTRYKYEAPVSQCLNEARLTPRSLPGQVVLESRLDVDPEPSVFSCRTDYFGNQVAAFSVYEPHDGLTITSTSVIELFPASGPPQASPPWEEVCRSLSVPGTPEDFAALEFCFDSPFVGISPDLAAYALDSFTPGRPLWEGARDLTARIHKDFTYKPKSTCIDTPIEEVLRTREGVCQDFAHIMIGALRSLSLAARYVSGYLRSGANLQGAQASHAWVDVYSPGSGWHSFDPTNNVIPSDGHIILAWGRDYSDVTPVKGITLGGGEQEIEVEVRVVPVR